MISKTAIHAIRALAQLATLPEGEFAGAEALAQQIGAPPNYLAKLLQTLGRNGLVESRKGLGGGFRLARSADTIRLADILEPIDQIGSWDGCFLGGSTCSDKAPCAVHERWAALKASFQSLITETTLASLIANKRTLPR